MFEVSPNPLKNRLYITMGRVRKDKLKDVEPVVEKAVEGLDSGFTCVTQVIDHREIEIADVEKIKLIQDYLVSKGMVMVVRVGLDSGTELIDEMGQIAGYEALNAKSLEEADKMLDDWEDKNK